MLALPFRFAPPALAYSSRTCADGEVITRGGIDTLTGNGTTCTM